MSTSRPHPLTKILALLVAIASVGAAMFAAVAPASASPDPTPAPTTAADLTGAMAVSAGRALASGSGGPAHFPPVLIDALGYEPVAQGDLAAHPEGDCSSPVPLPERFESACRVHDLGYDLLRVADRAGTPLPRDLRPGMDALLAAQFHESCDASADVLERGRCVVAASVADVAVRANTVRQSYGAPVEEWFPWA